MKIGFYNPYFDSFGGGERYTLTAASHWSKSHNVSVFWDDQTMLRESERRFCIDCSRISTVPNVFDARSIVSKLSVTSGYDCLFILSDGSISMSLSPFTIYHFQVPFPKIRFPFWKKLRKHSIVCNSEFTRNSIAPSVGKNAQIIYPPVAIDKFRSGKKEKIILSVGRFDSYWCAKKQDVLIEMFKEGWDKRDFREWKLILAGSVLSTDRPFVEKLKAMAKGYPIEFHCDIPFDDLRKLYAISAIYWHAAGFGETDPTRMEHFGITTVEAMATGCIPIVFNGGGQKEIISGGNNGFLWNTKEECIRMTAESIHNTLLLKNIRDEAKETAKRYSEKAFFNAFDQLLENGRYSDTHL